MSTLFTWSTFGWLCLYGLAFFVFVTGISNIIEATIKNVAKAKAQAYSNALAALILMIRKKAQHDTTEEQPDPTNYAQPDSYR